jgi:hypothetical protein
MKKAVLLGIGAVLGFTAAISATAIAGQPEGNDRSETLTLKHVTPSSLVALLAQPSIQSKEAFSSPMMPDGITQISPDDLSGKLLVRGSAESVKRLRTIAMLLDVPSQTVRLPIRIWRMESAQDSPNPVRRLVATATTQTVNNRAADVIAMGDGHVFQIRLTPHVNTNGVKAVTLASTFVSSAKGLPLPDLGGKAGSSVRVRPGTAVCFAVNTIRKRENRDLTGKITVSDEPRFGYVAEVTPEIAGPLKMRLPLP